MAFEGEIDRTLFEHAVDVVSPWVVIEQAIDREIEFVVEAIEQASNTARRLSTTVGENALVLLPELILIEALPDRVLFNVEDKLGIAFFELDHFWLDDTWDRISS